MMHNVQSKILLIKKWIGVCSYLLIGYYSHRLAAVKSAQKAILVNRVSDGMLLWGVLWIWYYAGSLEYDLVLLNQTSSISMFIVLSVLVGAMGKSAQILFHVWLADAMEGKYKKAFLTKCTIVSLVYLESFLGMETVNSVIMDVSRLDSVAYKVYSLISCSPFPHGEKGSFIKTLNETELKCSKYQMEAITGLMLSDGHIRNPNQTRRPTGNYRLEFTFKEPVLEFVNWLKFTVLKDLCTKSKPVPYPKEIPTQYWFSTSCSLLFTVIANNWYFYENNKRIKKLPDNVYLDMHFSAVSLAFMIMGDGYWDTTEKTVLICTENFQPAEVKRFIAYLKEKYGLVFTVKKRKIKAGYGLRMRLSSYDVPKLRSLVLELMHPTMIYKLGLK